MFVPPGQTLRSRSRCSVVVFSVLDSRGRQNTIFSSEVSSATHYNGIEILNRNGPAVYIDTFFFFLNMGLPLINHPVKSNSYCTSSHETVQPFSKAICFLSFASVIKYFRTF